LGSFGHSGEPEELEPSPNVAILKKIASVPASRIALMAIKSYTLAGLGHATPMVITFNGRTSVSEPLASVVHSWQLQEPKSKAEPGSAYYSLPEGL
jgi:hypothetical protein